jgi:hypothetical protein
MNTLRNHEEMIDLNPLVIDRFQVKAPSFASPEEYHAIWYEIIDRVSYLPGASSKVHYHGCFNDLTNGLQTHVYAPLGLEIKSKWILGGNVPGEPAGPVELGLGIPRTGLYLREDIDMKCNIVMTSFVKKTLKKAHGTLVDRLVEKAKIRTVDISNASLVAPYGAPSGASPAPSFTSPYLDHRQSLAPSISSQGPVDGYQPYPGSSQGIYRAPSPCHSNRGSYGPPVPQKDTQQAYGIVELPVPSAIPHPQKDNQPINELPA